MWKKAVNSLTNMKMSKDMLMQHLYYIYSTLYTLSDPHNYPSLKYYLQIFLSFTLSLTSLFQGFAENMSSSDTSLIT